MITQERLKELFAYDNGYLARLRSNRDSKRGSVVGCVGPNGYLCVRLDYKNYYIHRLIFLYNKGWLPRFIDHIDGNKLNNKIENLRSCSIGQNGCNAKISSRNSSGIKGVSWCKARKVWVANIMINKKPISLGGFWDKEVAGQVVKIERLKLHGAFANHG